MIEFLSSWPALGESSVETFQEFCVCPAQQQAAEGGRDVETNQVLVPLARRGSVVDDFEPS